MERALVCNYPYYLIFVQLENEQKVFSLNGQLIESAGIEGLRATSHQCMLGHREFIVSYCERDNNLYVLRVPDLEVERMAQLEVEGSVAQLLVALDGSGTEVLLTSERGCTLAYRKNSK